MQALESHIGDGHHYAVHTREQGLRELENAVLQYMPSLYRRAYRYVGDPHDAEDAVQDALLSAYKHLDQFRGAAQMTTWLTTIVMNSARTQLRRRPRQPHISLDEQLFEDQDYSMSDRLADVRPGPKSECIKSETHGYLMQFITELSPALRKVIQLRVMDGLTTSEAADILGVSGGTVRSQVSRARAKLKQIMRRDKGERVA
ncbi:MAG: sigma-70 family RNA polymerase sigma factor [Terracidiphilus sp.]|jgi:RNA polymerase sigma-70 factor (ECF subfamily)